jgi:hypothetical protein
LVCVDYLIRRSKLIFPGEWSPILGTLLVITVSAYTWWLNTQEPESSRKGKNKATAVGRPTDDSSPDDFDTQTIRISQADSGIDYQDDGTFTKGLAQKYPKIIGEERTNPNFRMDVTRFDSARQPSRDPSPGTPNPDRAEISGEFELTKFPTSPTSSLSGPVQRQESLGVPSIRLPRHARSSSNASATSRLEDGNDITVIPEQG